MSEPWTTAAAGRVPPRECIRAARDALTKAYSQSEASHTWPFMLEALDWLRWRRTGRDFEPDFLSRMEVPR